VGAQDSGADHVSRIRQSLEDYLRASTDIVIP